MIILKEIDDLDNYLKLPAKIKDCVEIIIEFTDDVIFEFSLINNDLYEHVEKYGKNCHIRIISKYSINAEVIWQCVDNIECLQKLTATDLSEKVIVAKEIDARRIENFNELYSDRVSCINIEGKIAYINSLITGKNGRDKIVNYYRHLLPLQ